MSKIIFLLWLLSGKVQVQKDGYGFRDFNDGRLLYTVKMSPTVTGTHAYKGEILHYIRTKSWETNENFSDDNGKLTEPNRAIDTLYYLSDEGNEKAFPVYKKGKKKYVIDEHLKMRIYIK